MSAAVVAPGSIAASPASLDHLVELLSTVVQQQQEGMKAMQTALEGISRQLQETNAHLTRFLDQQGLEAVKSRATEELAWAACKNVSPQVVRAHLDRGGDVHSCGRGPSSAARRCPALHQMVSRGALGAVEAVMAHEQPVDLTALDESGRSPLHVLASACPGKDAVALEMLAAILSRERGNPELLTVVDWAQEGNCCDGQRLDFLSAAAAAGRLSLFFPELIAARTPYYDNRPNYTLALKVMPQLEDWRKLSETHRKAFACCLKLEAERSTATTNLAGLLTQNYGKPELDAGTMQRIHELVHFGADVMAPLMNQSAKQLHYFLVNGPMEVVEELLQAPRPLDFTVADSYGRSALHFLPTTWCSQTVFQNCPKTTEEVRRLLHLVLDHLQRYPEEDKVDWGQRARSSGNHSLLSFAAASGHLSVVVDVLFHERPVPYFTQSREKIQISTPAWRSDVNRLRKEDLKRLDFVAGISESK